MSIQRFVEHLKAPWPNGRGTSYEIASQTPGVSGWTWRVAIAPVVEDCDFSHFENVHRQLLIISGGDMVLDVGGEIVICKPGEVAVFLPYLTIHKNTLSNIFFGLSIKPRRILQKINQFYSSSRSNY